MCMQKYKNILNLPNGDQQGLCKQSDLWSSATDHIILSLIL